MSQWALTLPGAVSTTYHTGLHEHTYLILICHEILNRLMLGFRLAGMAFVNPVVNYWWPSIPKSLTKVDFRKKLLKWTLRIATHAPGLLRWWVSKKCIPSNSALERDPTFFNEQDIEVLKKTSQGFPMLSRVTRLYYHNLC